MSIDTFSLRTLCPGAYIFARFALFRYFPRTSLCLTRDRVVQISFMSFFRWLFVNVNPCTRYRFFWERLSCFCRVVCRNLDSVGSEFKGLITRWFWEYDDEYDIRCVIEILWHLKVSCGSSERARSMVSDHEDARLARLLKWWFLMHNVLFVFQCEWSVRLPCVKVLRDQYKGKY